MRTLFGLSGRRFRAASLMLGAAVLLTASAAVAGTPPPIRWNETIPVGGLLDGGRGVAIDPLDQNPVVVGQILGPSTTVVVTKYDRSTGAQIWTTTSLPLASQLKVTGGVMGGIGIDPSGTIFVGGHGLTMIPPSTVSQQRYFVARCTSAGCGSPSFLDPPLANPFAPAAVRRTDTIGSIAVGPDGNPVLIGVTQFSTATFPFQNAFFLLTVKVDGSTLAVLSQTTTAFANVLVKNAGVAVDSSDDVFVTGTGAATQKYRWNSQTKALTTVWSVPLTGTKVAVGPDDSVAVIRTGGPTNQDFDVRRLDAVTGAAIGAPMIFDSTFNDVPQGVAFDPGGNIVVAGRRSGVIASPVNGKLTPFQDDQTVSFSPTGVLNWAVTFNSGFLPAPSGADLSDSLLAVAVGSDYDPVVTGSSAIPNPSPGPGRPPTVTVMRTIKYDVNGPPTADAGPDQVVECAGPSGTSVTLDASGSKDPDPEDTLSYTWKELGGATLAGPTTSKTVSVVLPFGSHTIELTVDDGHGATATDTVQINVVDTTPPKLTVPPDATLECPAHAGDIGMGTATDTCCGTVTITNDAPPVFQLGVTLVTWTASDCHGHTVSATQRVTVVDTTPPVISNLQASPSVLWPPNHKLVPVTLSATVTDTCDPAPTWKIVSVGITPPPKIEDDEDDDEPRVDFVITGDHTVLLRAVKAEHDLDRTYAITIQAKDASGNTSAGKTMVIVPHDRHDRDRDKDKEKHRDKDRDKGRQ